jgi:hypothetical protein
MKDPDKSIFTPDAAVSETTPPADRETKVRISSDCGNETFAAEIGPLKAVPQLTQL